MIPVKLATSQDRDLLVNKKVNTAYVTLTIALVLADWGFVFYKPRRRFNGFSHGNLQLKTKTGGQEC